MGHMISIVADDRESLGGVIDALSAMEGVEVVTNRLPLGDYLVDGKLLFERKTLGDLVESIKDGRLFRQGLRLAASKLRGIVILEGTAADLATCRMNREAIQGALISLSVIMGIPLLRSRSAEESARLMIYAARQVSATASGAIARKGVRPKGKRRSQLEVLQGLPGIGPARAATARQLWHRASGRPGGSGGTCTTSGDRPRDRRGHPMGSERTGCVA